MSTDATDQTIFSIEARGNILLPMTRDHLGLDGPQMNAEIWRLFTLTKRILERKGIDYTKLKSGLVPATKKLEVAFLFDTRRIESFSYGHECMGSLLPLLEPEATLSVLVGDMIANDTRTAIRILRHIFAELIPCNEFDFDAHPGFIFVIYVTNISETRLKAIHDGLTPYHPYIGFVETTYTTPLKYYFSTILSNLFLKHKKTIIVAHEGDRPNREDINITPYLLEKFGYDVRSLQDPFFGVFLTYKIERPVIPDFVEDTEIALNALSNHVLPLESLRVWMTDEKYNYLITNGKLARTSLAKLGKDGLEELISSKIQQSYIYQLRVRPSHQVSTFTIMLEGHHDGGKKPFRIEASLHYCPEDQTLRVVTMM